MYVYITSLGRNRIWWTRCLYTRQTADPEKEASSLNVCTHADVSDDARMLTCLMVVSHVCMLTGLMAVRTRLMQSV